MQPTMQLYFLVRSLDASEVKYVRAYAKRKVSDGTTSCLELFELVLKCKQYDEDKFAAKVEVSNFPALKVYLRDLIADALLEKEMKKKGAAEVMVLVGQIDIFNRKGFKQLMWARMEKALELCERYELFQIQRDLLYRKHNLLMVDVPDGQTPEGLEGFDEIYEGVKAKLKNLEAYFDLEEMVSMAPKRGSQAMYEVAVKLLTHPLMADDAPLLSIRAELKFCFVKWNILRWTNRRSEAMQYTERVVNLLEANSKMLADEDIFQTYISRTFHLGWHRVVQGNLSAATEIIEKLKAMTTHPILILERLHSIELRVALQTLNLAMGEEVISRIEEGFRIHEHKMSMDRRIAYFYQAAHFYLCFSLPDKALKWVLKLREIESTNSRRDLLEFSEILFLICHFDLGNYKFLKTESMKTLAYLKKRNAATDFEEVVIWGLRDASMTRTDSSRKSTLSEFMNKLTIVLEQDKHAYKINYFQFDSWFEAKMHGGIPAQYMIQRRGD